MKTIRGTFITVITLLLLALLTLPCSGATERRKKPRGVVLGLVEPYPALVGVNFAYSVSDVSKLLGGFGYANSGDASLSTLSLGVRFTVPTWTFSPFASIHFGFVRHSGSHSIMGMTRTTQHLYSDFGLDYLSPTGFNAGFSYKLSWTAGIRGLPSLYLGWYF